MNSRVDNFIIRQPNGSPAFANSLVLGTGLRLEETAGGLPELAGIGGEAWLAPSGGDDTARIRQALAGAGVRRVRLGPGTFTISDRITIQPGLVLAGSGAERTTLTSSNYQFVEMLAGSTVEALAMDGVYIAGGPTLPTAPEGVHAVRGVRVSNAEAGIEGRGIWVVSESIFENTGTCISLFHGQATMERVTIVGGGPAVQLDSMGAVRLSGLYLKGCSGGISVNLSRGVTLDTVFMVQCGGGVTLSNTLGAQVAAVRLGSCGAGLRLESVEGAVVAGCSVYNNTATGAGAQGPLAIFGGAGVSVNGFLSDASGTGVGAPPHILVAGGATEVMFTAVRVVNGTTPPVFEVDVSGAGGRVLFAQQNFDPARISSGGKYAAL